ncbi:MAG: DUF5678 domain-containing protein [Caldilineaceae bacterium]
MTTITLNRVDLVEQLQQVASAEDMSAEELLDKAVIEFLEKVAVQKLQDETAAFEKMHAQLVEKYLGEYVAVHNGIIVDHDAEARTLYLRIRAKLGQMPILLRQVTEDAQLADIVVRSPKLVKTAL